MNSHHVDYELRFAAGTGRPGRPLRQRSRRRRGGGFTLLELVVVISILVALATIVVPLYDKTAGDSMTTATAVSLQCLRDTIVGDASGPGYFSDMGQLPSDLGQPPAFSLKYLFVAPPGAAARSTRKRAGAGADRTYRLRRRPYVLDASRNFTSAYGQSGDPFPADAWGRPLVLQIPAAATTAADQKSYARLVSAGPDGIIQTPADVLYPAPAARGDDQVLFLYRPDVAP